MLSLSPGHNRHPACRSDLACTWQLGRETQDALLIVTNLYRRFHLFARQLESRHKKGIAPNKAHCLHPFCRCLELLHKTLLLCSSAELVPSNTP